MHLICAEAIASSLKSPSTYRLFYLKPDLESILDHDKWDSIDYLPWPRHFPLPGILGRHRRLVDNVNIVKNRCSNATDISLYLPVIDSEAYNYYINIARIVLNGADPEVNLIPDGLLNVKRHNQGKIREYSKYFRKFRKLITPSLDYYIFSGDRTGSDAPIINRIYTLPNIPHEYDETKAEDILFMQTKQNTRLSNINSEKALIIGQPLTSYKILTKENLEYLTAAFNNYLKEQGITEVDYKSHPRDKIDELYLPSYNKIVPNEALEAYLIKNPYKIIISIYSTTLLLSRILSSPDCNSVSLGIDLAKLTSEEEKNNLITLFKKNNVKVILSGKKNT